MRNTLLLCVVLATASVGLTQSAPPTEAQIVAADVQRYTSLLALSSAQQEQATTIFTSEVASETSLRETERAQKKALVAAIQAGNSETIQTVSAELGQLSGNLTMYHALGLSALYLMLTGEQQSRFVALEGQPGGLDGSGAGQPPRMH